MLAGCSSIVMDGAWLQVGCNKIDLLPVQVRVLAPVQQAVVVEVGRISALAKIRLAHQNLSGFPKYGSPTKTFQGFQNTARSPKPFRVSKIRLAHQNLLGFPKYGSPTKTFQGFQNTAHPPKPLRDSRILTNNSKIHLS